MHARTAILLASILATGAMSLSIRAQVPDTSHSDQHHGDDPRLINLAFAGGTALEYVEALKRAAGGANIVVMPGAAEVQVPPIQLTRASVDSAAYLLDNHVEQRSDGQVVLKVEMVPIAQTGEEPTFRIAARTTGEEVDASIWGVSDIIASGGLERADFLAAVEATLDVIGDASIEPAIRFHEATDLLIIRGTVRQRSAVEQVLDELRSRMVERENSPARAAQREMEKAAMHADQRQAELDAANRRLADASARADEAAGRAAAVEIDSERLRVRVESLQDMLVQREQQYSQLRFEADTLRTTVTALQAQIQQMMEAANRDPGSSNPR